jgi:hypothetical protein
VSWPQQAARGAPQKFRERAAVAEGREYQASPCRCRQKCSCLAHPSSARIYKTPRSGAMLLIRNQLKMGPLPRFASSVWGARGREFKSRRPDQNPSKTYRLLAVPSPAFGVQMESKRDTFGPTLSRLREILVALYFYTNPTNPTSAPSLLDRNGYSMSGGTGNPAKLPDKWHSKTRHGDQPCVGIITF